MNPRLFSSLFSSFYLPFPTWFYTTEGRRRKPLTSKQVAHRKVRRKLAKQGRKNARHR